MSSNALRNIHMVTINNQEMKRAFSQSTKTQLLEQPNQVSNIVVQPIVDITPIKHKVCDVIKNGAAVNATAGTIYAVPANNDFYITGVNLSLIKDATATSTGTYVEITQNGQAKQIAYIITLTLTAQNSQQNIVFPFPIKADRGTNITINNATAVGNISSRAIIYGFTDEVM